MASVEEKDLIIDENLKENEKIIYAALEKRAAHTAEKARLVMDSAEDETRAVYEKVFSECKYDGEHLAENEKYLFSVKKAVDLYDKLNCVDAFCPTNSAKLFENESESVFDFDTVVYLKNPLADIAYNNFSKLLNDPRSHYGETFSDVCEDVYYSRAPYCILPLDNSEEGRMAGFGNLIRKYELKIVLTCSVESTNGRITRFARLSE